jgi:hypothetical protein
MCIFAARTDTEELTLEIEPSGSKPAAEDGPDGIALV